MKINYLIDELSDTKCDNDTVLPAIFTSDDKKINQCLKTITDYYKYNALCSESREDIAQDILLKALEMNQPIEPLLDPKKDIETTRKILSMIELKYKKKRNPKLAKVTYQDTVENYIVNHIAKEEEEENSDYEFEMIYKKNEHNIETAINLTRGKQKLILKEYFKIKKNRGFCRIKHREIIKKLEKENVKVKNNVIDMTYSRVAEYYQKYIKNGGMVYIGKFIKNDKYLKII